MNTTFLNTPNTYFEEIIKKINNDTITKDDLDNLKTINHSQAYLYRAHWFYKIKDITKAKEEIEIAINLIDQPYDDIYTILLNRCETDIFRLAGKIYVDLNEVEKAKDCYIKSQYYSIQLDSGFGRNPNAILYSFRSFSIYSLSDLILKSITVCNPSMMNDPFDSLFRFWADKNNLISLSKKGNQKRLGPFLNSFNFFKIRCFIANKKLISDNNIVKKNLMWGHYADGHKGFCIKYRLSRNFIKKERNTDYSHFFLKRVKYQPASKIKSVRKDVMNTDELFALKSNDWKYENEIRLISYDPSCKEDHLQIPLDDESVIEAIYFGYRCSTNNIKVIMQILGENVKYYQMDYNPENIYKLNIKKISNKNITK